MASLMALYLRELVRSWRQGRQYRRAMNRGAVSLRKRLGIRRRRRRAGHI